MFCRTGNDIVDAILFDKNSKASKRNDGEFEITETTDEFTKCTFEIMLPLMCILTIQSEMIS